MTGERERIGRRGFLKGTLAAGALFHVVPAHVLHGAQAPSNRITRAVVGTGGMGTNHVTRYPETLAVCDVDESHLARALDKAGGECDGYADFRQVLDRDDIDTVHIATPPHWHGLVAIAAARAGKDVYCEKPMTHTIPEGRALIEAVRSNGRVLQVNVHHRRAHGGGLRNVVESGILGRPLTVHRQGGFKVRQWSGRTDLTPHDVPDRLNYDMWLGPAQYRPYHPHRVHGSFRGYWDYDAGGLGDMGQHMLDPIQFLLCKDDDSPVQIKAEAPPQHPDAVGVWAWIEYTYADETRIIINSGEWGTSRMPPTPGRGSANLILEGPNGRVYYGAPQGTFSDPPGILAQARAYPASEHRNNWHDAVRSRDDSHGGKPNVEAAHHSCTLVNLGALAVRLGRTIRWDPEDERVIGDREANRFVNAPMRAPWHL
jgi:predicted dehydrogenase